MVSSGESWVIGGYPQVNEQFANWKITIFKFGKSTNSMGHFADFCPLARWGFLDFHKTSLHTFLAITLSTSLPVKSLVFWGANPEPKSIME